MSRYPRLYDDFHRRLHLKCKIQPTPIRHLIFPHPHAPILEIITNNCSQHLRAHPSRRTSRRLRRTNAQPHHPRPPPQSIPHPRHRLRTGAVTQHLSLTYPNASTIYGIDISPVPYIRRPKPPPSSISYIQGDVKRFSKTDARLALGTFDYVFSRLLVCGMTDWAAYISDTVTRVC